MSYYNQIPDISRDQDRAAKALAVFQQIVEKYPNSEYVNDSKFKIQVTRDQIAGKEMSVGRFYLTRRNYTAAINRFRNVLDQLSDEPPCRGGVVSPDRGLSRARHHRRSGNSRGGAGAQFPGWPVV